MRADDGGDVLRHLRTIIEDLADREGYDVAEWLDIHARKAGLSQAQRDAIRADWQ